MMRSIVVDLGNMDSPAAELGLQSNIRHLYTIKKCYNCRKDRKKVWVS
jgi:hypothetical protein